MLRIETEIFNISKAQIRVLAPTKVNPAFQDATMGPFSTFAIAILTLQDEDGCIGEAPVFCTYNNILDNCILPILLHSKNVSYSALYHMMYWAIRNEGFRGQASALLGQVDLALHDLAARKAGEPLHRYLGASRDTARFYGSGGGTNYTLRELEQNVSMFLDAGTDCYKMKVAKDFGTCMQQDVERVKFVRNLLGKDAKLAVDANQVWSGEQALAFIDQCAAYDIAWFEEPVHSAALDQIEWFCHRCPVPVSYGESERTALVFPALVKAGVKHLQPVPTQIAGVREWMQVRDLASRNHLQFSAGGYSLFTASLVATAGEDAHTEYLQSLMVGLEEYFIVKPSCQGGMFHLPDVEGLPVRIDWDYCKAHNKILHKYSWQRKTVDAYVPTVVI